MKSVAYCRVSTDHEEQLSSLKNQISHYSDLFKKEGFEGAEVGMYYSREGKKEITRYISSIFADEGISGTKLKNREAFKYMLECAYRKEFDVIYVKNIQRWARSVTDGSGILKKLKVMGIKVIFEDGNLNNFEHEMTINILLSTAQEESRAKSEAVKFGIRKVQEQGKFTASAPYGYKAENGFLIPIKEKLEIVSSIFNWYLEGIGILSILKNLNNINAPTQRGGKWSKIHIYNILSNPIYAGQQITHTVINTDINLDKVTYTEGEKEYIFRSRKQVDEDKWIKRQKEELRAVTDDIFNQTQDMLQKGRDLYCANNRPSTRHIFSNLLYCRNCEKALRRKKLWGWLKKDGTRKMSVEWCCASRDANKETCEFRNSWKEEVLIERIQVEIIKLRENRNLLDEKFKDYMQSFCSALEVTERVLEKQNTLEGIKAQVNSITILHSKNYIDDEQFKEQNDELQKQRKECKAELDKLKRIDEVRELAKRKYKSYVNSLNTIDIDNIDNTSLKKIISRIDAYTFTNEQGEQMKDIHIIWNMIDKSFDDIFIKLNS